jgi:hypothetical protein
VSEVLARALISHLVRRGDLEQAEISEIADKLDGAGEGDAAHLCRLAFVEAHAPSQSEWEAERRRARMRVVPSDGGNQTT